MSRETGTREGTDLQTVLDALEDPKSRAIVRTLTEPMTAGELADACEIPLSTTYRKLDRLTEASLLDETTTLRSDGHHTTRYDVAFDSVTIALTDDRTFDVAVEPRPEGRLAALWSEVKKQV